MTKVLIDTNAYTALCLGDRAVLHTIADASTVYLSTIVMGELLAGFRGGRLEEENRARLRRFREKPTVRTLHVTPDTAELFGRVKDLLRRAGTPIPINDVWIAAPAVETGSILVTFDAHFDRVAGVLRWDRPKV